MQSPSLSSLFEQPVKLKTNLNPQSTPTSMSATRQLNPTIPNRQRWWMVGFGHSVIPP